MAFSWAIQGRWRCRLTIFGVSGLKQLHKCEVRVIPCTAILSRFVGRHVDSSKDEWRCEVTGKRRKSAWVSDEGHGGGRAGAGSKEGGGGVVRPGVARFCGRYSSEWRNPRSGEVGRSTPAGPSQIRWVWLWSICTYCVVSHEGLTSSSISVICLLNMSELACHDVTVIFDYICGCDSIP